MTTKKTITYIKMYKYFELFFISIIILFLIFLSTIMKKAPRIATTQLQQDYMNLTLKYPNILFIE